MRSLVTDHRKDFDLIDHNILYAKLQGIGLKPSTLNWISDFLRGRLQRVKFSPNCNFQTGNLLMLESRKELSLVYDSFCS